MGTNKNNENKETDSKPESTCNNTVKDRICVEPAEALQKRNYRKRNTSSDNALQLSEGEIEDSGDEINRVNLNDIKMAKKIKKTEENIDADSDFSIDESSDDENDNKNENEQPTTEVKQSPPKPHKTTELKPKDDMDLEPAALPKPKIDIWKKRTVGEVFEQALKRYYERKASRGF